MTILSAADLLELQPISGNGDYGPKIECFRAHHNLDNLVGQTFGGQAIGQALAAAQRTAPGWPANSLSGYFLSVGQMQIPTDFNVERVRDGRRFAIRRVTAHQGEHIICDLLCSFHLEEEGPQHQLVEFGNPPMPETLAPLQTLAAAHADQLLPRQVKNFAQPFPIELRLFGIDALLAPQSTRNFWFRMPSADMLSAPADHQALLALMSDYWMAGAIAGAHGRRGREFQPPLSLSHAIWFHGPARVDEWLLHRTESHWAAHGRGLVRGFIFNRQGKLVATTSQEALLRNAASAPITPA